MKIPASRLRYRLLLSAGAMLLALCFTEVGLRLYSPWGAEHILTAAVGPMPSTLFRLDPELGHRHQPDQQVIYTTVESRTEIRTNELGLRGPPLTPAPPDAVTVLSSVTPLHSAHRSTKTRPALRGSQGRSSPA